jgi:hypothetical protein
MEHWQAWCYLGGSLLGALGGLYLTYDILGGKDGPLAGVTRVMTYVALFGIAFSLGLGLKFGLIASLGNGLILGYDFYLEAKRIHSKGKPRHWITKIVMGTSRALVISIALMTLTNGMVFLFLFPIYALFLSATYLAGLSPTDNRRACQCLEFKLGNFWLALLRGLVAGFSFLAAVNLVSAITSQAFSFVSPWRVGLTMGGASFFVGLYTPWVEWRVEHLSRRSMALVGLSFAIFGFLIQAFPNWIVLLQ